MTPKLVISLAVAAVVSASAAGAVWHVNNAPSTVAGAGERLFPELIDKVNTITSVEVRAAGNTMSLKRSGEGWKAGASGYPVKPGKLQQTLVSLVRLAKMEPRTSSPAKYKVIQVEDAGDKGSKSRQVILRDQAGAVLGDVLLGKAANGYTSGSQEAQYVRIADEAQSWLVTGSVVAGSGYKDWVDTSVVRIKAADVKSVEITMHGGDVLGLLKTGKNDSGQDVFAIQGIPEGVKPKDEMAVRLAATDLANVEFADVRKPADGGQPVSRSILETDKRLRIAYDLAVENGQHWLRVSVLDAGGQGELAEKIKAAVTGWEFAIADYKAEQFQKRFSDLLDLQQ